MSDNRQSSYISGTFRKRLNELFADLARDPKTSSITMNDVAATMTEAGYAITNNYLSQLRNGTRESPSFLVLEGLCYYFGVPPTYFMPDTVPPDATPRPSYLERLREKGVKLRSGEDLSQESYEAFLRFIDSIENSPGDQ